jgi:hypothetical protein
MLLLWLGGYPQFWGVHLDERARQDEREDDEAIMIISLLEEDELLWEQMLWLN